LPGGRSHLLLLPGRLHTPTYRDQSAVRPDRSTERRCSALTRRVAAPSHREASG